MHPADLPVGALVVHAAFVQHLNGWDDLGTGAATGQVEVEEPQTLTLAPSDAVATDADSWQIVADDQAVLPDAAGRPWMVGGVSTSVRPHVLVIGDDRHKADDELLAGQVEQAVGDVRRLWSEPDWNGKVVVYAMADPGFQTYWFGNAEPGSMVLAKDVPSRISADAALADRGLTRETITGAARRSLGAGPGRRHPADQRLRHQHRRRLAGLPLRRRHVRRRRAPPVAGADRRPGRRHPAGGRGRRAEGGAAHRSGPVLRGGQPLRAGAVRAALRTSSDHEVTVSSRRGGDTVAR